MGKLTPKKRPVSITVDGARLFKIYGSAREVRAFFSSLRHDDAGDGDGCGVAPSFAGGELVLENPERDLLHAVGSYEEGPGGSFRRLREDLASGSDADRCEAEGEKFPRLDAAFSYEDRLGKSFRNLREGDNADRDRVPYGHPFLAPAGSYEEGLGREFHDLQERVSKNEKRKGRKTAEGGGSGARASGIDAFLEDMGYARSGKGKAGGCGRSCDGGGDDASVDDFLGGRQFQLLLDIGGAIAVPTAPAEGRRELPPPPAANEAEGDVRKGKDRGAVARAKRSTPPPPASSEARGEVGASAASKEEEGRGDAAEEDEASASRASAVAGEAERVGSAGGGGNAASASWLDVLFGASGSATGSGEGRSGDGSGDVDDDGGGGGSEDAGSAPADAPPPPPAADAPRSPTSATADVAFFVEAYADPGGTSRSSGIEDEASDGAADGDGGSADDSQKRASSRARMLKGRVGASLRKVRALADREGGSEASSNSGEDSAEGSAEGSRKKAFDEKAEVPREGKSVSATASDSLADSSDGSRRKTAKARGSRSGTSDGPPSKNAEAPPAEGEGDGDGDEASSEAGSRDSACGSKGRAGGKKRAIKSKIGTSLSNVRRGLSSKANDALKNKPGLPKEEEEEEGAAARPAEVVARTAQADDARAPAAVAEEDDDDDGDENMEPNIEAIDWDGKVRIGYFPPGGPSDGAADREEGSADDSRKRASSRAKTSKGEAGASSRKVEAVADREGGGSDASSSGPDEDSAEGSRKEAGEEKAEAGVSEIASDSGADSSDGSQKETAEADESRSGMGRPPSKNAEAPPAEGEGDGDLDASASEAGSRDSASGSKGRAGGKRRALKSKIGASVKNARRGLSSKVSDAIKGKPGLPKEEEEGAAARPAEVVARTAQADDAQAPAAVAEEEDDGDENMEPNIEAIDWNGKVRIGFFPAEWSARRGLTSEVDALENESRLPRGKEAEEGVARTAAATPADDARTSAGVAGENEDDEDMEPNIEAIEWDGKVRIGYFPPQRNARRGPTSKADALENKPRPPRGEVARSAAATPAVDARTPAGVAGENDDDDVDDDEYMGPNIEAIDWDGKVRIGFFPTERNARQSLTSKVDALKNKPRLLRGEEEGGVARTAAVTPAVDTQTPAGVAEENDDVDDDEDMEPNIEAIDWNGKVRIGFFPPERRLEEEEKTGGDEGGDGVFDVGGAVHNLSMIIDGAVAQTWTLGHHAMNQLLSGLSWSEADLGGTLASETLASGNFRREGNRDEGVLLSADGPSEEKAPSAASDDGGGSDRAAVDPDADPKPEKREASLGDFLASNGGGLAALPSADTDAAIPGFVENLAERASAGRPSLDEFVARTKPLSPDDADSAAAVADRRPSSGGLVGRSEPPGDEDAAAVPERRPSSDDGSRESAPKSRFDLIRPGKKSVYREKLEELGGSRRRSRRRRSRRRDDDDEEDDDRNDATEGGGRRRRPGDEGRREGIRRAIPLVHTSSLIRESSKRSRGGRSSRRDAGGPIEEAAVGLGVFL